MFVTIPTTKFARFHHKVSNLCYLKLLIFRDLGVVTTFAGTGSPGSADGSAATATFNNPMHLDIHPTNGDIYVADYGNTRVRKITKDGKVSTFAGKGSNCGADSISNLWDLKIDAKDGSLLVADYSGRKIHKITQAGVISPITYPEGEQVSFDFGNPTSLSIDQLNRVCYVCDAGTHSVRRLFLD